MIRVIRRGGAVSVLSECSRSVTFGPLLRYMYRAFVDLTKIVCGAPDATRVRLRVFVRTTIAVLDPRCGL